MEFDDFRDFLSSELAKRKRLNGSYSLRSFAKFLEVDPSFLTKLLQKKRSVTPSILKQFSDRLRLREEEVLFYKDTLFAKASGKSRKIQMHQFQTLSLEQARPILKWHCFAILELLTLDKFVGNLKNIANALSLPLSTIQDAILALENLRMVTVGASGIVNLSTSNNSVLPDLKTSRELVDIQRQFLLKSLTALDDVPVDQRDHTGMTLAIPTDKIPEAKKLIKNFRRRFNSIMQASGARDGVYQLSISFFPLSKVRNHASE